MTWWREDPYAKPIRNVGGWDTYETGRQNDVVDIVVKCPLFMKFDSQSVKEAVGKILVSDDGLTRRRIEAGELTDNGRVRLRLKEDRQP